MTRIRLLVAYDGGEFHGFARQPGLKTVGGLLGEAIETVLRLPSVVLTCAGRTDAGVHARGQVVTFDVPDGLDVDLDRVRHSVNKLCAPSVVVREVTVADPRFDARFSARSRLYRYTVLNQATPDPFLIRTAWHVDFPLEVRSMAAACDPLIGEHDFSSFCRRPKVDDEAEPEVSLGRRVIQARWEAGDEGLMHFWIEANAFCHQMVRSIVGTLVDVGRGRKKAGDLTGILAAKDRQAASDLAPPHGLCLWEVRY